MRLAGDRADDRDLPDDPLPGALTDVLAALEPAEIIDFAVTAYEVTASAYRWPLWNAAYLIEGGCGDDGFMDFRDGLVLLGREAFTRAVAGPDSLAGLPVVVRMEPRGERLDRLRVAGRAGEGGVRACRARPTASTRPWRRLTGGRIRAGEPGGENWDPEDADATRLHLPRLAALFLGVSSSRATPC
ncbi:hypothetical protein SMICM17S_08698 [Streptomyces microflavus]